MAPTADQAIQIAQAIEQRGWSPTPLHVVGPDGKTCSCPKGANCGRSAGKHNIAGTWQKDIRGSQIFVEMAQGAPRPDEPGKPTGRRWPPRRSMNVGILTGAPSGIFVLDIDPSGGGMESMRALLAEHGELPPTFIAQTGTGGWHFYFAMPDFDVRNSASSIAPGVDVRGTGGMVVAPGSVSYAGPYRIAQDLPPAPAPAWLLEAVRPKEPAQPQIANPFVGLPDEPEQRIAPSSAPAVAGAHAKYEQAIVKGELARVAQLTQAGWNAPWDHTTYQAACQLVELANAEWSSITLQQAHDLFVAACPPPEPGYSPETKWMSAEKTVDGKARPEPEVKRTEDVFANNPDVGGGRPPDPTRGDGAHREGGLTTSALPLSDLGNAERLITWHGNAIKYASDAATWLAYADGIWVEDSSDVQVETYVKSALYLASVNEAIMHSDMPNDPEAKNPTSDRDDFRSWLGKCQMYPKISAAKQMARSDPRLRANLGAFDQNPMLLNAANCVVNLSTGETMPHAPEHLFRHRSPAAYEPGTPAPMWQAFLARVQPDPAMRRYLQTIFGYSLTGRMDEHAFFIHVGTGSNGKTTMLEIIMRIVGDYAQKLERETLLSKTGVSSPGATPDIARMAGARLLGASEIPIGRKLDDDRVKELVGGDTQTARHLYGKPFDFTPTGKIHILTNHLPGLDSGGPSMTRRLRIVSWEQTILESEMDKTLKERIIMTEAAGVLDWLVQGAIEWAQNGLKTPESITDRSREHVEDADPVLPFIAERLELATDDHAHESEFQHIYGAYRSWCDANGNKPMSGKALSQAIVERLGHEIRFKHWQNRRSMFRLRVRPGSGVGLETQGTDTFFAGRGYGS